MHGLLIALFLSLAADGGIPAPDAKAADVEIPAPDAKAADAGIPSPVARAADAGILRAGIDRPTVAAAATAPVFRLPSFSIARVRTRDRVVALTFDACATLKQANGFDREVFDILKREKIPVTIFPTGRWIETHPVEAKELAAQTWVELGNHSYSHVRMTRIPRRKAVAQIVRTEDLIAELGRKSTAFRPPAGAWNRRVVRWAAQLQLPTVEWDVVSGDAGGHVPAPKIVATVLSKSRAGSIVIFHINERGPHTKEALPDILHGLRDKGFRFVTVSELLQADDARPEASRPAPFGYRPLHKRKPKNGASDAHSPS
jgi:peptidoglycan/xylan/chitin deacetylase (PgdA/CDA1 family)